MKNYHQIYFLKNTRICFDFRKVRRILDLTGRSNGYCRKVLSTLKRHYSVYSTENYVSLLDSYVTHKKINLIFEHCEVRN